MYPNESWFYNYYSDPDDDDPDDDDDCPQGCEIEIMDSDDDTSTNELGDIWFHP
jgi:hypothetical protein